MATATNSLDDKLKRLQEARKKAEEISQRRQRVAGELDGHKKRLAELEKKCSDEYGCEIKELPALIKQLEEEAEKSIAEAERILNPPAATAPDPEENDEDQPAVNELAQGGVSRFPPTPPKPPAKPIKRPVVYQQQQEDDVL